MVAALVLTVLVAVAAGAGDFDDVFARARSDYDDIELGRAARGFQSAAAQAQTDQQRTLALLWAGVAAGQAGAADDARVAFEAALALDRAAQLPVAVSPKVRALFDDALAGLPPLRVSLAETPTAPKKKQPATTSPTPTTTPTPTPTTFSPLPLVLIAGGGSVVALSAAVAVKAAFDAQSAGNPATPQVTAQGLIDLANAELVVAGLGATAGLIAGGIGAALLLAPLEDP